jgi:3-oxoacyl-[acyl-carrier-protein] synthase-3
MKYAAVKGTGSYLPEHSLTNHEIATKLDTSHEWVYSRTGISSRHIAYGDETTSSMAAIAAEQAVRSANIDVEEIDLIITATCTPDCFFPSTSCYVKHRLAIKRTIPAFDISVACSGFVYAMDVAKQYISTGIAQNVLVIGSEKMSAAVDWQDRATCVLFGDGAGAVLLSADDTVGIIASKIHADYDSDAMLVYANVAVNQRSPMIQMSGNEVFKLAVNMMSEVVDELLTVSQIRQSEINWLIPHQANVRIIKALAKKLQLPWSRVIVTLETQGNTSAASIPIALDHAIRERRICAGDLLLIEAFGGGMAWGGMLIRY